MRPLSPLFVKWPLLAVATLLLCACASVREKLPSASALASPYKIDIVQGNVVTREQAKALQPGMQREQVRAMLGTPLLTSVFHADRWDYVFAFSRRGQAVVQRRLTVHFKGNALERVESDELPSEAEFVSSLDSRTGSSEAPSLVASPEQLKRFESPASSVPPKAAAPAANYPPLEASGAGR